MHAVGDEHQRVSQGLLLLLLFSCSYLLHGCFCDSSQVCVGIFESSVQVHHSFENLNVPEIIHNVKA